MEEKKCPVDRWTILIALECCRAAECGYCPYNSELGDNCFAVALDALAYIGWLEEQLGVTG